MQKKSTRWISLFIGCAIAGAVLRCYAGDADVKLTTTDGSTQFTIQNSNGVVVSSITSLGTVSFSSNTVLAGATFYQNGRVVMGGSNTQGAVFISTVVTLGTANSPVYISSNTIMPGATFYYGGSAIISSNTVLSGATFYNNGPIQLGNPTQSVVFSTNAVLNGTTFYQNGRVVIGGAYAGSVTISTAVFLGVAGSSVTVSSNLVVNAGTVTLSTTTVTGFVQFFAHAKADFSTITPSAAGQVYFCSDCKGPLCISTGTAAGQFAAVMSSSTLTKCACQ